MAGMKNVAAVANNHDFEKWFVIDFDLSLVNHAAVRLTRLSALLLLITIKLHRRPGDASDDLRFIAVTQPAVLARRSGIWGEY